jgi:small-conductance mechanosensitive channel
VDLEFWLCLLFTSGLAVGAGLVALLVVSLVVRIGRGYGSTSVLTQVGLCARPLMALAMATAIATMANLFSTATGWQRVTTVLFIGAACWLMLRTARVAELVMFNRLRMDVVDNRRIRRARTQVTLLRRVLAVAVVLLGIAGALMTFPEMHAFGASLFASAGIAGIVAGLAAQTTLANMFAGMQLVFTDAVRMDDVVVVEGEWGWIEEITLTYVIVHIWDERRLVLPTSYFTSKPFQNWTRNEARVLGSVVLYLDYETPLTRLREQARIVIEASPLWDRQDWVLQVVDTTEHAIVVRVLASAADGPTAWDLRCEIRESLIAFLQENCPKALPVRRVISLPAEPELDLAAAELDLTKLDPRNQPVDLTEPAWGQSANPPPPVDARRSDLRRAERRKLRLRGIFSA